VDKNGTQQLVQCLIKNSQGCRDARDALQAFEEARAPKIAQLESAIQTMLQNINDALEILQG
jgi:hypothetical protein